jgi:hypothetical protein
MGGSRAEPGHRDDLQHIGVRNWLVICCVVTDDSQEPARGNGPFEEGAEPAAPDPVSGSPYPALEGGDPYGPPTPTSASPYSASPTSPAAAHPAGGASYSYGPFHAQPASDPYGLPQTGRRIEPSPPPAPHRLLAGILAGLAAGLLLFGTAGWFLGRTTATPNAPKATEATTPGPAPTTLGVFERSQATINEGFFAGTGLVAISEGWLPYLSNCGRSGRSGGPALNSGEKVRVRCTLDGMSAIFVEYASAEERDRARETVLDQNAAARTLTPGVVPATERRTPSGRAEGHYVEYAFKLTENGGSRIVSGIWWDDVKTPIAGYLLAFWKEGLGERWEPMRDLWSRYA